MTDRPQLMMLPIQRPAHIQMVQAQPQDQGDGLTRIQRTVQDPNTLNRIVQSLGSLVNRGTQPAQDLGSWISQPISDHLFNPFGRNNGPSRAQMPGQRATFFGR